MGGRGSSSGMYGSVLSKVSKWGRTGQGGLSNKEAEGALKLAGINQFPEGVTANIRVSGDKTQIKLNDAEREVIVVKMPSNELYIDMIHLNTTGTGEGTNILNSIRTNAKQQGITKLSAYAAGDPTEGTYNGYYSLARFGFDAPLSSGKINQAKSAGFNVSTVQDLMKTAEGRRWWKNNGIGFAGEMSI